MTDPRTKEELIEFVRSQLEAAPRGAASRLAEALGKSRSVVSEILAGKRNISAQELAVIKGFFGSGATPTGELQKSHLAGGVPVVGRIGENIWTRAGLKLSNAAPMLVGAIDTDYPVTEQSAWLLEETTTNGELRQGDIIFTVPFDLYRRRPLADDIVVVRTRDDGFERFTLRQGVPKESEVVLASMFPSRPHKARANEDEEIVGLFIGHFRPYRKR